MIIGIGASTARRALALLAAPLLLSVATGCSPSEPAVPSGSPPIARVWASRCGACHTPVEPGTRSKSHLDDALGRHKTEKRVALSDAQWSELREFLAGSAVETAAR